MLYGRSLRPVPDPPTTSLRNLNMVIGIGKREGERAVVVVVAVAKERKRALTTDGGWMDLIECCAVQWCTRETVRQGETHTCFVFVKQCS